MHLVGYIHSCITMHGFMNVKCCDRSELGTGINPPGDRCLTFKNLASYI